MALSCPCKVQYGGDTLVPMPLSESTLFLPALVLAGGKAFCPQTWGAHTLSLANKLQKYGYHRLF